MLPCSAMAHVIAEIPLKNVTKAGVPLLESTTAVRNGLE